MEEKTLTQHPEGRRGVSISKGKYETVRASILGCLQAGKQLTYTELAKCVGEGLSGRSEGSVNWYVEVVKLDLEATKVIERVPKTSPQLYRLVEGPDST